MAPAADNPSTIQVARQRFKLRAWMRTRLWAQVLAGLVLGLGAGLLLSEEAGLVPARAAELLAPWLGLPGRIFLALIAMVLIPLVFCSVVGGLTGAGSGAELRAVGLRLGAYVLVTTCAAAGLGLWLAHRLQPGAGLPGFGAAGPAPPGPVPAGEAAGGGAPPGAAVEGGIAGGRDLPDLIADVLPSNPGAAIVSGDMLAVVVLALLVGISVTQIQRERAAPFLALLDALLSISMNIVKWAMFLTPYAVFGLMAQLVMRVGAETLLGVSGYVGTVLLGLALLLALYLAIAAVFARLSPARFLRESGGTLLLAFSTSSSSAVMPATVQTARRLGVSEELASLVVPLGATMNMAGTALYQAVAILFLAQLGGIELSLPQMLVVAATLVGSSIGAPGTPGVSIAILVSVAASIGIPAEGMVIILGVDRLLDMCRTVVNVTGDLVGATLLQRLGQRPGRVESAGPAAPRPSAGGVSPPAPPG